MARPSRDEVFDPTEVGTDHCVQRTDRRAFLCGADSLTKLAFDYREQWIRQRPEVLAGIFAFDCKYPKRMLITCHPFGEE